MNGRFEKLTLLGGVALVAVLGYFIGHQDGNRGVKSWLVSNAEASGAGQVATGWSPTKPYPDHEVYFPGTEELGPTPRCQPILESGSSRSLRTLFSSLFARFDPPIRTKRPFKDCLTPLRQCRSAQLTTA